MNAQPSSNNSYTVLIRDTVATFTHIGINKVPAFKDVTAVAAIPFDDEGNLVAVNLFKRGYDLVGGHVEKTDIDALATVRREAMEEAMITLRNLQIIEVIQSDYFSDRPTYLLVYAARIDKMFPFENNHESSERLVISPEVFIKKYTAGNKALMAEAIHRAQIAVYNG